jgi:hypothetical protein
LKNKTKKDSGKQKKDDEIKMGEICRHGNKKGIKVSG